MWSSRLCGVVGGIAPYSQISQASSPLELHITQSPSERLQPGQDGCVGSPRGEGRLGACGEGAGPFEGLTFGLEVDGSVTIGRLDARMTEPVADRDRVDTGTQKVNGRAMAKRVGMHALGREMGYLDMGLLCVAPEDVAHAKAGQRFAITIAEDWRGLVCWVRQRSEQRPK